MKCNGMRKEKTKNGRKIEVRCNTELDKHALFCKVCGQPTGALSGSLSAKVNYQKIWEKFKLIKSQYYSFSIFIVLTFFLLIGLGIFFSKYLAESFKIDHYLFVNLMLLILVPFVLIPFGFKENFTDEPFKISMYFKKLKKYPKFFLLVLVNILYFLLLKIFCTGYILGITVDPILHPVRFILVLYWITITFPAVLLISRKKMNPIKAVISCYRASAETRWQQFFVMFRLFLMNVIGAAFAGLGLLVTIPFSYILIEKYYQSLDEFELFE
ncbi:MAG: hypothetical protein PF570_03670 [Candidatus Cloacimonetes bacterium]|jgi:hypothetical protein|nr:hypothetical protein [Candidatus Cloacimonadota bacterium]